MHVNTRVHSVAELRRSICSTNLNPFKLFTSSCSPAPLSFFVSVTLPPPALLDKFSSLSLCPQTLTPMYILCWHSVLAGLWDNPPLCSGIVLSQWGRLSGGHDAKREPVTVLRRLPSSAGVMAGTLRTRPAGLNLLLRSSDRFPGPLGPGHSCLRPICAFRQSRGATD